LGASNLDTSFASCHLAGRKSDILEDAQQVADELFAIPNVRMVWSVARLGESLPAQFQTGGKGRENLNRLTLADKSATGQLIDYGATQHAILTFGEEAQLTLSLLSSEQPVGPSIESIVTWLPRMQRWKTSQSSLSRASWAIVLRSPCSTCYSASTFLGRVTFEEETASRYRKVEM
jgi:hypothetical protein